MRRRNRVRILWYCVSISLLVQGCTSLPERNPLPEGIYSEARVLGMSDLRWWGDEPPAIAETVSDEPTLEELKAVFPGLFRREMNFLAISGGGQGGAYAAGVLNGWSAAGTRPEFSMVTGVSTGALIAPFAFLGVDYDYLIERFYTQYSTEDLVRKRGLIATLTGDAGFDTTPLRSRIAEYVDETLVEAIAAEHRRGRWLFIGTTNLDAGRPVIWDIGAIADSGKPGAMDLIRDVMLASASVPVAFPPVVIPVEAGGEMYDEMHTDGGVSRQSFLFHLSADEDAFEDLQIVGKGQAYVIRNSKLVSDWQAVDRKLMAIAGRSASSLVLTQGVGDLYREFLGAAKYGFDFNLAHIPDDFQADSNELFDRDYMLELYKLGYERAADGYPWKNIPPGLEPE